MISTNRNNILKDLIAEGEHQTQDFKFGINDSRKIARSLSAFANTEGGRLLIGVKDNGVIAGIRSEEEYYMIDSAATVFCLPKVDFSTKDWKVDGKQVLEIRVPPSKLRPHFVKEADGSLKAYIRHQDENLQANEINLAVWKKEKDSTGSLVRYSNAEKILFDYLSKHKYITLEYYESMGNLTHNEAVNTLANMILFDLIRLKHTAEGIIFESLENPLY